MSQIKYKIQVDHTHINKVRVSSDVERMGPEMLPIGNSDWNIDNWDDNYRSKKLIRAIGARKRLGFFTVHNNANEYWYRRYKKGDQIDAVRIKVMGNGFSTKVMLYEAKVIPISQLLIPMNGKWCIGYTLQFNESDAHDSWTLND